MLFYFRFESGLKKFEGNFDIWLFGIYIKYKNKMKYVKFLKINN